MHLYIQGHSVTDNDAPMLHLRMPEVEHSQHDMRETRLCNPDDLQMLPFTLLLPQNPPHLRTATNDVQATTGLLHQILASTLTTTVRRPHEPLQQAEAAIRKHLPSCHNATMASSPVVPPSQPPADARQTSTTIASYAGVAVLFALMNAAASVFRGAAWHLHSREAINCVWRYLACVFEMLPICGDRRFCVTDARRVVAAALLDTAVGAMQMHPDVLQVSSRPLPQVGAPRAEREHVHRVDLIVAASQQGLQECLRVFAAAATKIDGRPEISERGTLSSADRLKRIGETTLDGGQPAQACRTDLTSKDTLQARSASARPDPSLPQDAVSKEVDISDGLEARQLVQQALVRGSIRVCLAVDADVGSKAGDRRRAGADEDAEAETRAGTGVWARAKKDAAKKGSVAVAAEAQMNGLQIAGSTQTRTSVDDQDHCSKSVAHCSEDNANALLTGQLLQQQHMQTWELDSGGGLSGPASGISGLIYQVQEEKLAPNHTSQLLWLLIQGHLLQQSHTSHAPLRECRHEHSASRDMRLKRSRKAEIAEPDADIKGQANAEGLNSVHSNGMHSLGKLLDSLPQPHVDFLVLRAWRVMEQCGVSRYCSADKLTCEPGPSSLSSAEHNRQRTAPSSGIGLPMHASAQSLHGSSEVELMTEGSCFEPSSVQVTMATAVLESAQRRASNGLESVRIAWGVNFDQLPTCLQSQTSLQAAGPANLMAAAWWLFAALSALGSSALASERHVLSPEPKACVRNAAASRAFYKSAWQITPRLWANVLANFVATGPPREYSSQTSDHLDCRQGVDAGACVSLGECDVLELRTQLHAAHAAVLDGVTKSDVMHKVRLAAAHACSLALHQVPPESLAEALQMACAQDTDVSPAVRYVLAESLLRQEEAAGCLDVCNDVAVSQAIARTVDHALAVMASAALEPSKGFATDRAAAGDDGAAGARGHALLVAASFQVLQLGQSELQSSKLAAHGRALLRAAFPIHQESLSHSQACLRLHLAQVLFDALAVPFNGPSTSKGQNPGVEVTGNLFAGQSNDSQNSEAARKDKHKRAKRLREPHEGTQHMVHAAVATLQSACEIFGIAPVVAAVCVKHGLTVNVAQLLKSHFAVVAAASEADVLEIGPLLEVAVGVLKLGRFCGPDADLHALARDLAEVLRPLAFKALLERRRPTLTVGMKRKGVVSKIELDGEAKKRAKSKTNCLPLRHKQRCEQDAVQQKDHSGGHSSGTQGADSKDMLHLSRGADPPDKNASLASSKPGQKALVVQLAWLCLTYRPLEVSSLLCDAYCLKSHIQSDT